MMGGFFRPNEDSQRSELALQGPLSSPSDSDLRRHVVLRDEGLGINNGTAGTGRLVEI
jgi:hypothetical protein